MLLRPDLAILPMPTGVQLRAGDEEIHHLRTDAPEALAALLALCDGTRTLDQLRHANPAADTLLGPLLSAGLLTDTKPPASGTRHAGATATNDLLARYLSHFAESAPAGDLAKRTIALVGHARFLDVLAPLLREHGPTVRIDSIESQDPIEPQDSIEPHQPDHGPPADLLLCAWEAPDLSLALAANARAIRTRTPCLFVDLSHGQHATVGPLYVPGEGACYACFRRRLLENSAAPAELAAAESHMLRTAAPLPAYGLLPAFRHHVAGVAAAEAVAFLTAHRPPRTLNRALTIDLERLTMWDEPAWRIPWCPACGEQVPSGAHP